MAVDCWITQCNRLTKLFDALSDEQLAAQTAAGRNTGIYLARHLVDVTDNVILPLMGYGEKVYPQLEKPFITSGDGSGEKYPSVQELKKYWKEINEKLSQSIAATAPNEWFTKHSAVSAEDFAKKPHRNKLNILINRTNHNSYHFGQLIYLKPKQ